MLNMYLSECSVTLDRLLSFNLFFEFSVVIFKDVLVIIIMS